MSDIKLFLTEGGTAQPLESKTSGLEKTLQTLIEQNLQVLLGVHFLKTEHDTGKTHSGRIDTLGIDENRCPVIIEYKRSVNENIINQGLFYLDWLLDNRAEFKLLVMDKIGKEAAEEIEWSAPRLLCIASDFTRYDEHAIQQIDRNVELIRYRHFGENHLLLELINTPAQKKAGKGGGETGSTKGMADIIQGLEGEFADLVINVKERLLSFGDDVQMRSVKSYIAFHRLRNFACVIIRPKLKKVLIYSNNNPDDIPLEEGYTRDMRGTDHNGTGTLEISVGSTKDLDRAEQWLRQSYEGS